VRQNQSRTKPFPIAAAAGLFPNPTSILPPFSLPRQYNRRSFSNVARSPRARAGPPALSAGAAKGASLAYGMPCPPCSPPAAARGSAARLLGEPVHHRIGLEIPFFAGDGDALLFVRASPRDVLSRPGRSSDAVGASPLSCGRTASGVAAPLEPLLSSASPSYPELNKGLWDAAALLPFILLSSTPPLHLAWLSSG
jgi:hypothetical protein